MFTNFGKKILNLARPCLVPSNGTFTSSLAFLDLVSDYGINSSLSKKLGKIWWLRIL